MDFVYKQAFQNDVIVFLWQTIFENQTNPLTFYPFNWRLLINLMKSASFAYFKFKGFRNCLTFLHIVVTSGKLYWFRVCISPVDFKIQATSLLQIYPMGKMAEKKKMTPEQEAKPLWAGKWAMDIV